MYLFISYKFLPHGITYLDEKNTIPLPTYFYYATDNNGDHAYFDHVNLK